MYFPVSSFLWTDCIAVFIFVFISNRDSLPFWVFHAVSWGIPAIQVAVVAAFGMEGFYGLGGTTGGWCWIRNVPSKSQEWLWIVIGGKGFEVQLTCLRAVLVAAPLAHGVECHNPSQWASIMFTGAFYLLVYRLYRRRLRLLRSGAYALRVDTDDEGPRTRRRVAATAASTTAASEFTVKLIAVPLVFFGARLFGNINVIRTLTATTPRADIDTLDMLQVRPCQCGFAYVRTPVEAPHSVVALVAGDVRPQPRVLQRDHVCGVQCTNSPPVQAHASQHRACSLQPLAHRQVHVPSGQSSRGNRQHRVRLQGQPYAVWGELLE